MDLQKLSIDDIKGFDGAKLRETEKAVRKALLDVRMDIYTAENKHTGKIRGLRRTLAQVLTVAGATKAGKSKASTKKSK
jgi:ribosomal protein L29